MSFIFRILFPLVIIIASIVTYFAYLDYETFKQTTLSEDIQSFEIKKGANIRTVAKSLQKQNIITSTEFFRVLAKLNKQENSLKAGEYFLKKGSKPEDLLTLFSKGQTLQYRTRLPEGLRFKQLIPIIKKDPNLVQTLSDDEYKNIMQKLDTKYSHHKPEGWFFPDTYSYPRGTTDLQFLQRAHNQMQKFLNKEWENRIPFKGINTPYDALILASIIEKETADPRDQGKVSRVFINRLKVNMLLQTDPTVIYGMGDSYKGNIRKKHLKKDTPYNTYTRKGLTPTPISTPSAASIKAAFNPEDAGDILFFVAKGDGTSYFSKTYREHKKAVIKYLLNGKASRYQGDK